MKNKVLSILKSVLWCVIMLVFPIVSGFIVTALKMGTVEGLFLQGGFMAAALVVPLIMVLVGKWNYSDIGFDKFDKASAKRLLFYLPFVLIFIPVAISVFYIKSTGYFFGVLFLYLFVGLSEEVYFRGIIPYVLKKDFSLIGVIVVSSIIFGIGHLTTAFTSNDGLEIALTVLNAFIFGFMAIELAIIANNIIPGIIIHFLFDFETKIIVMSGKELLIAECVRGAVMVVIAVWLALIIYKNKDQYSQK